MKTPATETTALEPLELLYQNADAAFRLQLACRHAFSGLKTIAAHLTDCCDSDDEELEGYCSMLHALAGYLEAAEETFGNEHRQTYEFPSHFQRPALEEAGA